MESKSMLAGATPSQKVGKKKNKKNKSKKNAEKISSEEAK